MRVLDGIVLVLFVVGLIILCFLQQCGLDIYFLLFGFAVVLVSLVVMIVQNKKKERQREDGE